LATQLQQTGKAEGRGKGFGIRDQGSKPERHCKFARLAFDSCPRPLLFIRLTDNKMSIDVGKSQGYINDHKGGVRR
jgi:hypothetical protein